MKRFWHTFMAIVVTTTMANTANAQSGTNGEIGSYQSILSRAGYGNSESSLGVQLPTEVGTSAHADGDSISSYASSIEGGAVIDQGYVGDSTSPVINDTQPTYAPSTWSQPVISQPVISQPVYSTPTYVEPTYETDPIYIADQSLAPHRSSNWVFGIFGVNLRRDYEDGIKLGDTSQGSFFSDDVRNDDIVGGGASLTKRNSSGSGWEVRYWGLDENDRRDFGPGTSSFRGLDDVLYGASTAKSVLDSAENLSVARSTRINSLAFNLLKNGGSYQSNSGRFGNYEMLAGFRIFNFDEDFSYGANNSATLPTSLTHSLEADNLLTGFQVGARNEVCLSDHLRLSKGFNVGIFNNRIDSRQAIFDENGTHGTIASGLYAGTPFTFKDQKNDVAFLGEINIGVIWQLSHKARLNAGYKALGVAGVALAADQIPRGFTDVHALQSANSNGSLLLHGSYFGAEFSF